MSLRTSASAPCRTSGGMYWKVPTNVPRWVRPFDGERRSLFCESKVEELSATWGKHHIPRLQVAVENAPTMRTCESLRDLYPEFQRLLEREGASVQAVSQRFSLQVLHDQLGSRVLRADVIELTNVGMIQRRNRSRFAFKTCSQFGIGREMFRQNLDCDHALQASVAGAIHFTHAAGTERRLDFIGAEFGAHGEAHRCEPL